MKHPAYYSRLGHTETTLGGNLPHWSQACATFVTFRLADSLPQEKLAEFIGERTSWLDSHPKPIDEAAEVEYRVRFQKRFHDWLDAGYGSCILREASVRQVVEKSLMDFADIRYSLYAFVVKPNHVHVLFMPEDGFDGRQIVRAWKSYTAKQINRLLNRTGIVWQKESYDHLVRDVRQFNAYRAYIRHNDVNLAYDAYAVAAEAAEEKSL